MAKGDLFLKLEGVKSGVIKGEAHDSVHEKEIDIIGWSWMMDAPEEVRGGGRTGRASMRPIRFTKMADSATTALMSAMYNNEKMKKAVLTVRKTSGAAAIDYLVITLKDAFVTRFEIEFQDAPAPGLIERFDLRFAEIDVTYSSQDSRGHKQGAMSFNAQVSLQP